MPSSHQSNYRNLYSEVLGLVSQPQVAYTRSGTNLTLNQVGQPAFDQSIIPFYNVYFSDTWRVKPSFTLTYSLGWALELPPYEINGKQVEVVDSDGTLVTRADYLAQRKKAALAGQVYRPVLGFETDSQRGRRNEVPHEHLLWRVQPAVSRPPGIPKFDPTSFFGKVFGDGKTVLRGGYGRIWGRINGVNLVLAPLLGIGPAATRHLRRRQHDRAMPGREQRRPIQRLPHRN